MERRNGGVGEIIVYPNEGGVGCVDESNCDQSQIPLHYDTTRTTCGEGDGDLMVMSMVYRG